MHAPPLCRHCHRYHTTRPRGLCWRCYYTPGVIALYPSTSKFARRGVPNKTGAVPAPAVPVSAGPGEPEKVAELEARAGRGESLWHPRDSGYGDLGEPALETCRVCQRRPALAGFRGTCADCRRLDLEILMPPTADSNRWRWTKADGSRLVLTQKGALKELNGNTPALGYLNRQMPCTYEAALVYAQLHGYTAAGCPEGESGDKVKPNRIPAEPKERPTLKRYTGASGQVRPCRA